MNNLLFKILENNKIIDYNELEPSIIAELSVCPMKEKYLKYTRLKEFYELSLEDMDRITKNISGAAEKKYLNGENFGIYTDYNGFSYYYHITSNDTYGITKIEEYNEFVEEVTDETNINKYRPNFMENR